MTQPTSKWKCARFTTSEQREGFVAFLAGLGREGVHGIEFDRIESPSAPGCWFRAPEKVIGSLSHGVQAHGGKLIDIDRDEL